MRTRLSALLAFVLAASSLSAHARDSTAQVEELLAQMTLEEKIGQMTQVDMNALTNRADVGKYFLGSVLSGGSSDPSDISARGWLKAVEEFKAEALKTRLRIPLLYGIDAVHGHNNVNGAVIFPHNIGLGATGNPELVERAARATAEEIAGTGIHWTFAPCVAVVQNDRWGRTYEGFGDDPDLVSRLGVAAITGLQGTTLSDRSLALACAKHFIADGGTVHGKDQGNAEFDEAALRKAHLPPYAAAVKAGVGSIMVSYSSWNGTKMHGHKYLITGVLKGELGFKGFVVSDWAAIDQLEGNYKSDVETSINAGLDMIMIPRGAGETNNYVEFIANLRQLVREGKVTQERIDDAVRRILTVKFQMGLFEQSGVDPALTASVGSKEHRETARECVRQSLVLLKNKDGVLPLSKSLRRIAVIGKAADDVGVQCGGWTITWQGASGQVTGGGTTILEGLRSVAPANVQFNFSPDGANLQGAELAIVVLGEKPYAEMKGDTSDLRLPDSDVALIANARHAGIPVVAILLSGRPRILGSALEMTDAFVAAWLPGTEGQGVADVLFGNYKFSGKLPRHWPRRNQQLVGPPSVSEDPLFPRGFGLTYP